MPSTDVGAELKRSLRRLTGITVVLILVVLGGVVYAYVDSGNQRDDLADRTRDSNARVERLAHKVQDQAQRTAIQSAQLTKAVCTLRAELQRRVDESVDFLSKHPNGIPGISVATLKSSIANTQQSVKALSPLKCRK